MPVDQLTETEARLPIFQSGNLESEEFNVQRRIGTGPSGSSTKEEGKLDEKKKFE